MADSNDTEAILTAIGALGEQVGAVRTDIAGLKKTDEHLASEVHRIGEEQRRQGRELQELKAETLRTFESERHASQQTVRAITKHVDEAAQAFHAKAEDIDHVKKEVGEVKKLNVAQNELLAGLVKHPTVRKLGAALAGLVLLGIGYATVRIQSAITKLEEKPAMVQAAPTVYVPVYIPADGGTK